MAIGKRQNYPRNMTNFQNPINGLKSMIFHDKKGEKFLNCFFLTVLHYQTDCTHKTPSLETSSLFKKC